MIFGTVSEYTIGAVSPLQMFWFADVCLPNFSWAIWAAYGFGHIALGVGIKWIGFFKGWWLFLWAASRALIAKEILLDQHTCADPAIPIWLDSIADMGFVFLGFAVASYLWGILGWRHPNTDLKP
ncbi:hypothetical protein [Pacificibacter marinus]|uniref:hypothetical protein n=1 Tax=Pacificibacter marinus TaxID=658057 RepID=UPI001C075A36|nr:hypothetical protein [Pacificibacter marinus]MBU2866779.1 hypothetical protein [Pacificibacter marinus]